MSYLLQAVSRSIVSQSSASIRAASTSSLTYQTALIRLAGDNRFVLSTDFSSSKKTFSKRTTNSKKTFECSCREVLSKKIYDLILSGNHQGLREHLMRNCQLAEKLRKEWDSYVPSRHNLASNCKAEEILRDMLASTVPFQPHLKGYGKGFTTVDLSALTMEEGKVTLAGEGGALVGREEYWAHIFEILRKDNRSLHILSIGGGTGDDGIAISAVFRQKGLIVNSCKIVDPNFLAAWLSSKKDVDFYAASAQEYFSQFFVREIDNRYVFHLGTLLNVVQEVVAIEILEILAKKMTHGDILSIVMVDEKQFAHIAKKKYVYRIDSDNSAGLSKLVHTESGNHYKTIIGNQQVFLTFCESLGLKRIESTEVNTSVKLIGKVTFIAFKGLKQETDPQKFV